MYQRVTQKIIEHPVQHFGITANLRATVHLQFDLTIRQLRLQPRISNHILEQLGQVYTFFSVRHHPRFEPGQRQQFFEKPVHFFSFSLHQPQELFCSLRLLPCQIDNGIQPC